MSPKMQKVMSKTIVASVEQVDSKSGGISVHSLQLEQSIVVEHPKKKKKGKKRKKKCSKINIELNDDGKKNGSAARGKVSANQSGDGEVKKKRKRKKKVLAPRSLKMTLEF